ncbi:MAG: polymer-forming cytoskeletal protein [Deltaproteobacteria bacterium]|nr:polymer-forming cytoskeletal protein [Deltaproteobacteria bacterium]
MVKGSAEERSGAQGPARLGPGLRVVGHVRGDGDLCVQAKIEGDVAVSGHLSLEPPGQVVGTLSAGSVLVAGEIEGDVTAQGTVAITATGQLRGDVRAKELSLEPGGRFDGRIDAEFDLPEAIA